MAAGCGGGGDATGPSQPPTGQNPTNQPKAVASITLSPEGLQGKVGQGGQLTATLRAADGSVLSGRAVTWSTSNAGIATVTQSGWVAAVGVGTAQITAASEGKSARATVVVSAAQTGVAAVIVTPAEAYGYVGDSGQFSVSVRDASGAELTDRAVTWATSNAAVARVSSAGVVTATGVGTATISATSEGVTGRSALTIAARPTTPPATTLCAAISGALVYADDGQYLGRITNRYDSESIFNSFGTYGSKYSSTSIWNEYGQYGGKYATLSPFNPYTSRPPVLVKNGTGIAYLTVNTTMTPRVTPYEAQACGF